MGSVSLQSTNQPGSGAPGPRGASLTRWTSSTPPDSSVGQDGDTLYTYLPGDPAHGDTYFRSGGVWNLQVGVKFFGNDGVSAPQYVQKGAWAPNTFYPALSVVVSPVSSSFGGAKVFTDVGLTSGAIFDPANWKLFETLINPAYFQRLTGCVPGQFGYLEGGAWKPAKETTNPLQYDVCAFCDADNQMVKPGYLANVTGLGMPLSGRMYIISPATANATNLAPVPASGPPNSAYAAPGKTLCVALSLKGATQAMVLDIPLIWGNQSNATFNLTDIRAYTYNFRLNAVSNGVPSGVIRRMWAGDDAAIAGSGSYNIIVFDDAAAGIPAGRQASPVADAQSRKIFVRLRDDNAGKHFYYDAAIDAYEFGETLQTLQASNSDSVNTATTLATTQPGVVGAGFGALGSENGYRVIAKADRIELGKFTNGVYSVLADNLAAAKTYNVNIIYNARLRIQASTSNPAQKDIRVRAWAADSTKGIDGGQETIEPAAWDIQYTDAAPLTGAGRWGVYLNQKYLSWYGGAYATDDGTARRPL